MSRIGKAPIDVPSNVEVTIDGSHVTVRGAKGELEQTFHPDMIFELEDETLLVKRPSDSKEHRSLHGLTRALLNNMVVGVSQGFQKRLQIEGVGYRAEMQGAKLVLQVGHSHPVEFEPPEGISFEVLDRGKTIVISGNDKQVVGEISAKVRKTRPPEPYKGKGIRYEGEYVRRKAGKAGKVQ
jgi:large subunit ribosomal protein L6